MQYWKSTWIILVAVLHTAFAIFNFGGQYRDLIENGFIN